MRLILRNLFLLILACFPAGIAHSAAASGAQRTVAITHATVIPMDSERLLSDHTVLVRDGVIVALAPSSDIDIPDSVRTIDAGGKFVMPGLADMHVHYGYGRAPGSLRPLAALYISNGVTTTLEMSGEPGLLHFRDWIDQGEVLGPKIYTASPSVTSQELDFAAARALGMEYRAQGYDFIKLHHPAVPLEAARGLASIENGLPLIGHVLREVAFEDVLANIAMIAHAEEIVYSSEIGFLMSNQKTAAEALRPELIPAVLAKMRATGTWLTTTLSAFSTIIEQTDNIEKVLARPSVKYFPDEAFSAWNWGAESNSYVRRATPERLERLKQSFAFQKILVRDLNAGGVPMLAGADGTFLPGAVPGFSLHDDIAALHQAGLTRYEALEAATANPGRFIQEYVPDSDPFGTIAIGSRGDLIILNENPLEDLEAIRRPEFVIVRGQVQDRNRLDDMLEALAYRLPVSFEEQMRAVLDAGGDEAALVAAVERYTSNNDPRAMYLNQTEGSINALASSLLREDRREDSLAMFKLNTIVNPEFMYGYKRLGDAYETFGYRKEAIAALRKAISLDENGYMTRTLEEQIKRLQDESPPDS